MRDLYIIGEDMNLLMEGREAAEFDNAWKQGLSLYDIARALRRDPDEVAVIVIDRRRRGFIKNRPGGLHGNRMPEEMT